MSACKHLARTPQGMAQAHITTSSSLLGIITKGLFAKSTNELIADEDHQQDDAEDAFNSVDVLELFHILHYVVVVD